jgi:hypothetical protein
MRVTMKIRSTYQDKIPVIEVGEPQTVPQIDSRVNGRKVYYVDYTYGDYFIATDGTKIPRSLLIEVWTE